MREGTSRVIKATMSKALTHTKDEDEDGTELRHRLTEGERSAIEESLTKHGGSGEQRPESS